jgi:hypothetical protein
MLYAREVDVIILATYYFLEIMPDGNEQKFLIGLYLIRLRAELLKE